VANVELGNSSVKTIWRGSLCSTGGQRDALTLILTVNYRVPCLHKGKQVRLCRAGAEGCSDTHVDCKLLGTAQYGGHNTVRYSTVRDSTGQYCTVQHRAVQSIQYDTVLYNIDTAIQSKAVQHSTVKYSTVQ